MVWTQVGNIKGTAGATGATGATGPAGPTGASALPTILMPESFGAKGDGVTDDTSALQAWLNAGGAGKANTLTPGSTYLHASHLNVTQPNTTMIGTEATLYGSNPSACSLYIGGPAAAGASGVTAGTVNATNFYAKDVYHRINQGSTGRSGDNFNVCPFALDTVSGVVLENCTSDSSIGSGFFYSTASNFKTINCTTRNSLADGHHVTNGSIHGVMIKPVSAFPGDDMFANVSYVGDATQVSDILWIDPRGFGQGNSGRGFTVVGATNVRCFGGEINNSWQAGIYVAAESGSFNTRSPSNVVIDGMKIDRANLQTGAADQGGILLYAGFGGSTVTNVLITNIQARDAKYVKYGNNGQGATGSSSGGTFSNCVVKVTFSGLISNNGLTTDVGTTGVTTTLTFGSLAGLFGGTDPVTAYLAADFVISTTASGNPSSAFNQNYIQPGTYEFEIEGAYAVAATTTKPVFNFGNNQGSVLGIKYEFYVSATLDTGSWVTSSNGTATPGSAVTAAATAFPFRVAGVVTFTSATGNNVWAFQVASSVAGSNVTIKAGTRMVMRRIA